MADTYHRLQRTQDGIHIPYSFEYATEAERLSAANFVAEDNGKLARQIDNNSLWMLIDHINATWIQVGLTPSLLNKLSSVQSGAEVNQSAFSIISVTNANIEATSKTDRASFISGTGINISGDASTKRITFSTIGHANSHLPGNLDAIPLSSSAQAGLMAPDDKVKLENLFPLAPGNNITFTQSNGNLVISSLAVGIDGISHNSLTGLNLDDHRQYLNLERHAAQPLHTLGTIVPHDTLGNLINVTISNPNNSQVLTYSNGQWINANVGANGEPVVHSTLVGLDSDDHLQYLTANRHNSKLMHQFDVIPHDNLRYLTDVSVLNPVNDQILSYLNGVWTNKSIGETHAHNLSEVVNLMGALDNKISITQKGVGNGVASLNENGKIPIDQIPSDIGQSGIISHTFLSNLSSDDHKQYISIDQRRTIAVSHVFRSGLELRNTNNSAAIMCQPEAQSSFIVYRSSVVMDTPIIDMTTSNNQNSMLRISRLGNVNNTTTPCMYINDSTDSLGSLAPTIGIHARTSASVIDITGEGTGYLLSASTATGKGIGIVMGTPNQNAIELVSLSGTGSDIKIEHQSIKPAIEIVNSSADGNSIKINHAGVQSGVYCISNNGIAIHGHASTPNNAAIYAQGAGDSHPGLKVVGTTKISSLAGSGNRAVYSDSDGVLINQFSDQSLKKNVIDITNKIDVISVIRKMRGIYFNWDTENTAAATLGSQREIGFIAQDMEKILPEVVATNLDNLKSIDYARIVAILVEAIKIQQTQIERLEDSINIKRLHQA